VPAHCRRMRRTQCPTVHSRFTSVVQWEGGALMEAHGSARQLTLLRKERAKPGTQRGSHVTRSTRAKAARQRQQVIAQSSMYALLPCILHPRRSSACPVSRNMYPTR